MKKATNMRRLLAIPLILIFAIGGTLLLTNSSAAPNTPNDPTYPIADTNADLKVNILDLSYTLGKWGTTDTAADFNTDNTVNIIDLSYLLAQWGRVDTPAGFNTVSDSNYLQFDGVDDYVSLNNLDLPGSALTLEAWVNSSDLSNCSSHDCRIVSKATGTAEGDHYFMVSTIADGVDDFLRFRLKAGGVTETLIASTGDMGDNTWHHIAATYDGSSMKLYLDGIEVGSTTKTGTIDQAPSVDTWIGGSPSGASEKPWAGFIDDVRIWNVARTASELMEAKNTELSGSEAGLLGYYKFNETNGQAVPDSAAVVLPNDAVLGSTASVDTNDPSIINNIPDITPPSAPSVLVAVNPTGTTIDLAWSPATDDVAIGSYAVYRDGSQLATVYHPEITYTDTGLSPTTTYLYQVYAIDTSNNSSLAPSNTVASMTTAPDVQVPTVPSGLSAITASSSSVNLAWSAATDNVAVTAYVIRRDGVDVATVLTPVTTYQDSGLSAETSYSYTVRATDAAGNHSPESAAASDTTSAQSAACTWDNNPNNPQDDPNPPYNGTEGTVVVSANPVPVGYPTPQTTGLCGAGLTPADLTPYTGSDKITVDGTVIDGKEISTRIVIDADDVVIRNSRITSTSGLYGIEVKSGHTRALVEDTRIRAVGKGVNSAIQGAGPITLRRVHITGGGDNIKSTGGFTLEDSYVTGLYRKPLAHMDTVQIRSGKDYIFKDNSMIGPWRMSTSVFIIQAKGGSIDNVLLEGNYISGGGFAVYTTEKPENGFFLTNTSILNNRFELDSYNIGWRTTDIGNAPYVGNSQVPSP